MFELKFYSWCDIIPTKRQKVEAECPGMLVVRVPVKLAAINREDGSFFMPQNYRKNTSDVVYNYEAVPYS